ncbi:quinolinate synthase NadA [Acidaminococcus timonensis]|uniref:quinolinate synthase NadA n=1 Tax=Acidaminococcus timonensis TaxID=1871002 RepID=UPI0026F0EFF0|nr:quinolinate synthase NadA [Acidaminococcus timonensis]
MEDLYDAIARLKKERNAVILAHVYQPEEIQEIADFCGDSFGLSQEAARTDADVIVFCGVRFMAETANILSPDKITLLPAPDATCRMFDDTLEAKVKAVLAEHPEYKVVSYVNTPASVKALSEICCTSSNAVKVVESLPKDQELLFVPDQDLASFTAEQTHAHIIPWKSACPTHFNLTVEEVQAAKKAHPNAPVLMHPECRPQVRALADYVGSTTGIVKYAEQSDRQEFIIATECGVLTQLAWKCPHKKFYISGDMLCPNMKKTTLEKVKKALETLEPRVVVPEPIAEKARIALERMLEVK